MVIKAGIYIKNEELMINGAECLVVKMYGERGLWEYICGDSEKKQVNCRGIKRNNMLSRVYVTANYIYCT